ncbi:MAG: Uma2 family endonuclease [Pirellulales bacterium]|nr:Uma2 family endonuclease [Pirellulales bacterium]
MATITEQIIEPDLYVLHDVSWEFYEACLNELGDRNIRLTYDRGTLEFMSPSETHNRSKRLLGRLIEALTEELGIEIRSEGSTTWRKKRLRRGLEPDEAYYVEHEPLVRGRETIDPAVDPPPDLVIEVEVTRRIVDRLGIYAALGVREIWRCAADGLRVFVLGDDGKYHEADQSPSFPFLPLEEVNRFFARRNEMGETAWVRSFREWVRQMKPHWTQGQQ